MVGFILILICANNDKYIFSHFYQEPCFFIHGQCVELHRPGQPRGLKLQDQLSYTIKLNDSPLEQGVLNINFERGTVVAHTLSGIAHRLKLRDEDYIEILRLTTKARSTIYFQDSKENSQAYDEGPDCEQTQEDDILIICQAQEISSIKTSGIIEIKGYNSLSKYRGSSFSFNKPTNLSIESAEIIIFLESMRIRTMMEGAVDP